MHAYSTVSFPIEYLRRKALGITHPVSHTLLVLLRRSHVLILHFSSLEVLAQDHLDTLLLFLNLSRKEERSGGAGC